MDLIEKTKIIIAPLCMPLYKPKMTSNHVSSPFKFAFSMGDFPQIKVY